MGEVNKWENPKAPLDEAAPGNHSLRDKISTLSAHRSERRGLKLVFSVMVVIVVRSRGGSSSL